VSKLHDAPGAGAGWHDLRLFCATTGALAIRIAGHRNTRIYRRDSVYRETELPDPGESPFDAGDHGCLSGRTATPGGVFR
jgi:hypothetical protein